MGFLKRISAASLGFGRREPFGPAVCCPTVFLSRLAENGQKTWGALGPLDIPSFPASFRLL
jgi:hypothetical protein